MIVHKGKTYEDPLDLINRLEEEVSRLNLQNDEVRKLLVEADSHLSAVYHRFGNRIPDEFGNDIMLTVVKIRTIAEKRNDAHVHDAGTCTNYLCREALGLPHLPTCTCIGCERKRGEHRCDGCRDTFRCSESPCGHWKAASKDDVIHGMATAILCPLCRGAIA